MKWIIFFCIQIPLFVFAQTDFEKGQKLFKEGKFTLAQTFFENYLKENNSNLQTIEYLGDIHGNLKNWDKALFYYNQLKKIKPTEANYYYKYGGVLGMKAKESNAFLALKMIGDVKAAFEKAIQLNPKHIEARWALIEIYLQLPGIVGGSERKAKGYADELYELSPVDGYLSKGKIAEYFERYKEAEKQYKLAFELGHSKVTFQKLYNLYLKKLKDNDKALKLKMEFEKSN